MQSKQSRPAGFGRFRYWLACCVFIASIHAPTAHPAETEAGEDKGAAAVSPVSVRFHDGRLSVSAKQAPLVELMRHIGKHAGFEVTAYGDLGDRTVSSSFSELRLADAVKRLLRNTSAVVSYRKPADAGQDPAISKIYLLGSGSAGSAPVRINTVEPSLDNSLRFDEIESGDAAARIASIDRAEGLSDEITLENLAFSLNHDPDPEVRLKAVSALERIGGSSAADALESGLGDDDVKVRQKVVETLGGIDDERIPLWLGQVLMGDPSPEVRLVAVQSIARKEGDVARIFLEAAASDSSESVREAALGLLR